MANKTVAVIGASQDRRKYGNQSVRAHRESGYTVYPVNPKGGEIEGLVVYTAIDEVPVAPLDRVSLYLPPSLALAVLPAIAQHGCRELWLNPGADSPEVVEAARQLGLNVVQGCSIVDCRLSADR